MTTLIAPAGAQWLAAEDDSARAEREAGWHWAWGADVDADAAADDDQPRAFVWDLLLDRPLAGARLLLAAQKGLPRVWLDGRPLQVHDDPMAGRELQDLDLGDLPAGSHRLAVLVRTFHPFIQEPRQGGQPVLQGLWHNTLWSQRSNFVGLPTDCPQRDERLGWTGDAQVFWPTAAFNMDVRGFTRRFLADLRASQRADGAYADTNPSALPAYGAHGWSDAGVVLPHTVWQHYGETALIDEHWPSMERWMAWIAEPNADGLWRQRREVDFGDWLSLDAQNVMDATTPKLLTATACWARQLGMMVQMANATGRAERAAHFCGWQAQVLQAFNAEFVRADGSIGNHSQTGYILPLAFGLLPESQRQAAADHLATNIRRRGTLLSTGFLGTPFSLDVLAEHGHADLAVSLLLRTAFPSWGCMVARGATTIWERWNGDTGDLAMNSFNHYALGAVTGFLYRRVAGIASASPGFGRLLCRPLMDARLGSGRARHDTLRGTVRSAWGEGEDGRCWFTLDLPPGMLATVQLPGQPARELMAGQHRLLATA